MAHAVSRVRPDQHSLTLGPRPARSNIFHLISRAPSVAFTHSCARKHDFEFGLRTVASGHNYRNIWRHTFLDRAPSQQPSVRPRCRIAELAVVQSTECLSDDDLAALLENRLPLDKREA